MNVPRQADPRANQKARTRAALVEAAARLLREGSQPTVAEAADAARVSRATAYRYFPTQEALLLEVAEVTPMVAVVEQALADLPSDDVEARLERLLEALNGLALAEEVPLRTALRVYLDTWLAARREGREDVRVREGRRMRWLDAALAPARARLPAAQARRLRSALALTLGVDAVVVMKDVCGLPDREAAETLRWAAMALLREALAEAGAAPRRRGKRGG